MTIIIISIYPGGGSGALQRYYNMLAPAISGARSMANKYGVSKVYIGEVGVLNLDEEEGTSVFFTAMVSKEKEAEFYDTLFTTTNKILNGYTVPYSFVIGVINDQPAESVVQEWFGKL